MMYFSVDQIGEDHIECENDNGEIYYFKIKDAPKSTKEGDILKFDKKGKLIKDTKKTKKVKNYIKNLLQNCCD